MNVNAIKGFFYKLKSYIETFNPTHIVVCNDISRSKTFRRKMYKAYKSQRKESDPDIVLQMEYVSRLISLLGIPIINNELYEADDLLGMISRLVSDNMEDTDTVIVSSDKDLYQLIDNHTFIMNPKNGEIIDSYWIEDNYKLTPDQWIELKMLQGDRGDNIPGIPGIGEVSALRLITEYNDIENVYKHINQVKPKISDLLIRHKDDLDLMRKLVTIVTDYKLLDLNLDMLKMKDPIASEILLILNELELYSLINIFNYDLIPYNGKTIE
jgi:DNA-directed DNA polymerase